MGRHEDLVEHYEDALFTLLVEKCMEEEGGIYLALNEALKRDPGDVAPPGAFERGLRTIHRAYTKQKHQRARRMTGKILTRVAVAVCCMMLLFMTAFAVSPALREQVYALIKEVTEVSTDFSLVANPDSVSQPNALNESSASIYGYSEPVVPEGFTLVQKLESEERFWRLYSNEQGNCLRVVITLMDETSVYSSYSVDTEDASVVDPIKINSFDGLYIEKDNTNALFVVDTENGLYISIIGENVNAEVLMSILEHLQYIE